LQVLETFAGRLIKTGVLTRRDIPRLTKYQIILARDQYRKNPSSQTLGIHPGIIEGDFALCISLYHGYELLLQMGVRSLFIYLWGIMDGSKELTRTKNELGRNEDFLRLYQQLRDVFADASLASANGDIYKSKPVFENKNEFIYSHPKLKKLEEIVVEHFKSWKKGCSETDEVPAGSTSVGTRVMIFSSFRDSVQEIADMLSRLSPVVRVMTFLGHSTGKNTKGFTQKEQLEVVRRFREGGYNTLVSTCVGEEGLDIGEVDLIICFDAQKSPVRLVQRMGRTGRRRQGRIVVILAEGREERTYNQSQSNKRSIHKAISGNKMLHFYQHSPRMIPEGINPKIHKMFITAEKYQPSHSGMLSKERRSSSLQHKSALFSCVTGQKQLQCHENWALSPEEFERWDRLYRIKEGDGVKEPMLPQTRFETLENLEEISKHEEEATRELSLSEWRVWQSCPFPTCEVGHSDRCHLFISLMETIERLRHEQGECSYELEVQPHLHMEDVHVGRKRSHLAMATDHRAPSSRRDTTHRSRVTPFLPDPSDNGGEFFSTFKIPQKKPPKRHSGLNVEVPELPADTDTSPSYPTRRLAEENAEQDSQRDEELEVTFDLNECVDLCDSSESALAHEGVGQEYKACRSLGMHHADSGYSSFTAEKSPASPDLFYLPESFVDSFAPGRPLEEPSWLEGMFSCVKRLLAQSPPSLSKMNGFEDIMRTEETACAIQKGVSDGDSESLEDKLFPAPSEGGCSVQLSGTSEQKATRELSASVSTCLSRALSPAEADTAKEQLDWDDSFDNLFDSEEFPEIPKKAPAINPALTNSPSDQCFVQEDLETGKRNPAPAEDKSRPLFEDAHLSDTEGGSFSRSQEHLVQSDLDEEVALGVSGDASVTEQLLDHHELHGGFQELFAVNFDLGFSLEEWESETCGEATNANGSRTLTGASGSPADVKPTEDERTFLNSSRLETSPNQVCRRLERRDVSTPLLFRSGTGGEGAVDGTTAVPVQSSGGRRMGSGSLEALASALSTPTRRKVTTLESIRRTPMSFFSSARQEIPELPLADGVNPCPQRQNQGSSATDALDSPSGRAENLEDTNLHRSLVIPAEGTSSESEEEIVFQRKNRKRKNVLKSPDALAGSDSESPIRATRKRGHPLSVVRGSCPSALLWGTDPPAALPPARGVPRTRGGQSCGSQFPGALEHAARQFLDEEAELSQQDDGVSSDEEEDEEDELSSSLAQFLNDDVEATQVLNDSAMKAVYLASVRSPARGSSYRMVQRHCSDQDVFSQIPEQDQAYAEDSFCVGEEEEETCRSESSEEEVCVNFDLLNEESFSSGRKQYLTRCRRRQHQARGAQSPCVPGPKKPSRIIVLSDSSEEETGVSTEKPQKTDCCWKEENSKPPKASPSVSAVQHVEGAGESSVHQAAGSERGTLLLEAAAAAEALDFQAEHQVRRGGCLPAVPAACQLSLLPGGIPSCSSSTSPCAAPAGFCPLPLERQLCILAASREVGSGAGVISALKALHGVRVQVCPLGPGHYLVSSRLAVERRLLSQLQGAGSRSQEAQRIQRLRSTFERVCVIVEQDRIRPGEPGRGPQRTQHCAATLAALALAGVRLLFSSCQEETAALLRGLALAEQRKGAAIALPAEPEAHKRDVLSFYLSIPNLSYLAALNMCHRFGSVRRMVSSSPPEIAAAAQVSAQKAEEIYRYLRYGFDPQLLPQGLSAKGRGSAAAR
ncbi:FANCM protein, partial [Zapornia atra]|nr:FANCM protein [Zapornia atra]